MTECVLQSLIAGHKYAVAVGLTHGRRARNEAFLLFVFQDVGLVDYHSHAREYSSHLAQPHRRRPSLLSEFQPGNER